MLVGLVIGLLTDHLVLGTCFGMSHGCAIGVVLGSPIPSEEPPSSEVPEDKDSDFLS